MGIFKTSKLLYGNPDFINTIATVIESKFRADGYDVRVEDTYDNGKNIDISKGGVFKRVLGMRQDMMTLHWRSRKELYMLPEESKNSYLYMTNCRLCIKDEMKAQTS